ncbi:hypothetical protein D3C71_1618340 [compost metagenome]
MVQRDPRGQPAAFANFATGTDEAMRTDGHTRSNTCRAFDHRKGTNTRSRVNHRVLGHNGCRVNAGSRFRLWIEQVGNTRVGQIRIRHDQRITGKTFGISSLQ